MRHRLAALVVGSCTILLLALSGIAIAADVVVQNVSTEGFPTVSLDAVVPAAVLEGGDEVKFRVAENGKPVRDVESQQVPSGSRAVDVVLVIDTSGSMKGDALASAQEAAAAFIDGLRPGSRAAVVSFSSRPKVESGLTDDASSLKSAIGGLTASGETALYDALVRASELTVAGQDRQSSIVVLSDGGDTASKTSLDAAVKLLRRKGTPAFVVSLPSAEADPAALSTIAKVTGGKLFSANSLDQLVGYYEGLAKELQTRYAVRYRSNQPSTKDLEIAVSAKGGQASAQGVAVVVNPLYLEAPKGIATLTAIPAANLVAYGSAIALVFTAVLLLGGIVLLAVTRPRSSVKQLEFYDQLRGTAGDLPDQDTADPDSLRSRLVGAVDRVAGKRGVTRLVYDSLERAGLPLRPAEYIAGHFAIVLAVGIFMALLSDDLLVAVAGVVAATAIPILWLRMRADSRRRKFEEQLPDVLQLMAGSLRAGWGMLQSVELVTREMPPPVSDEFRRVETEARLGLALEDSLNSMARRVDSEDLYWTVSAITIQREVGGNLAEVLDIIASTMRDRAALRRQIKALTSEGRLSAVILIGLPFVEFGALMLLNPHYMSLLFTTVPGLFMTVMGLLLVLIGAIWLRAVMRVEV